MKKRKNFRDRVRIDVSKNGVTIWLDNTWIIDASTFLSDRRISIDTERLKRVGTYSKCQDYIFEQFRLKRGKK